MVQARGSGSRPACQRRGMEAQEARKSLRMCGRRLSDLRKSVPEAQEAAEVAYQARAPPSCSGMCCGMMGGFGAEEGGLAAVGPSPRHLKYPPKLLLFSRVYL